jgi:hypothetical protein
MGSAESFLAHPLEHSAHSKAINLDAEMLGFAFAINRLCTVLR